MIYHVFFSLKKSCLGCILCKVKCAYRWTSWQIKSSVFAIVYVCVLHLTTHHVLQRKMLPIEFSDKSLHNIDTNISNTRQRNMLHVQVDNLYFVWERLAFGESACEKLYVHLTFWINSNFIFIILKFKLNQTNQYR